MTPGPWDAEFTFELLVCRWAETAWPPDEGSHEPVLVGRQIGTSERRWDTVVVEVDPAALRARAAFGPAELDSDLLHVVRNAPTEWTWYRDALPYPGYPWRYVRAAVHRAADRGAVERRRAGNRIQIRRVAPYPEWVRRIVAVENKPDLDAAAARSLADQLRHDVETALADEVWVATAATGERIEPALLESIPVEVGILAVDTAGVTDASVEWFPGSLDPPDTAERRSRRLELAERAYGRGWRAYLDSMRPDCRHFALRHHGRAMLPWCEALDRHQTGAECAGSCPHFEPEPPTWRTRGWPIAGGPGKGIREILDARRERARERASGE